MPGCLFCMEGEAAWDMHLHWLRVSTDWSASQGLGGNEIGRLIIRRCKSQAIWIDTWGWDIEWRYLIKGSHGGWDSSWCRWLLLWTAFSLCPWQSRCLLKGPVFEVLCGRDRGYSRAQQHPPGQSWPTASIIKCPACQWWRPVLSPCQDSIHWGNWHVNLTNTCSELHKRTRRAVRGVRVKKAQIHWIMGTIPLFHCFCCCCGTLPSWKGSRGKERNCYDSVVLSVYLILFSSHNNPVRCVGSWLHYRNENTRAEKVALPWI